MAEVAAGRGEVGGRGGEVQAKVGNDGIISGSNGVAGIVCNATIRCSAS